MDWNLMSLWTLRSPAGQVPSSIADQPSVVTEPDAAELAATNDDAGASPEFGYFPIECVCGDTHLGWSHPDTSQPDDSAPAVRTGPLHDRIRMATYKAYRHAEIACVCGAVHAGWDHREPLPPREPAAPMRQVAIALPVETGSTDTPRRADAASGTRVAVAPKPRPAARKSARRRSGSRGSRSAAAA